MHLDPRESRVGTREVEELEDAERATVVLRECLDGLDALLVHDDELARTHLALELGADEIEGARLRRDHPVGAEAAETERSHAARISKRDKCSFGEHDDGEGAVELGHCVPDCLLQRRRVVRDQRRDHLGVRGGGEPVAVRGQLRAELGGVRQVPVVAERDRSGGAVLHEWLRVPPLRRPGRRVARMPDRKLAVQAAKLPLVEHLRDEAHLAQRRQAALVGDRYAGGLLAAVLQREQAEVRDPRDVALGRANAEQSAHQRTTPIRTTFFVPSRSTSSGAQAISTWPPRASAGRATSADVPL